MSFVLQGEVRIDGKTAKGEIKDLERAQDKLKTSTKTLSGEGKKAASSNRQIGVAARKAAADVKTLSNAERIAATNARTLGRSNQIAAGQIGNLTAQFNDIGVMLMAGQNPLQLAIQQGTQITQVIGPMGAAGAFKALKAGIISMVSPISLITLGSIAAGATMVQWLTESGDEAETLDDIIGALSESVDGYTESATRARGSSAELAEEFGSAGIAGREMSRNLEEILRADALEKLRKTASELTAEFGGLSRIKIGYEVGQFSLSEYETAIMRLGVDYALSAKNADLLVSALEQISLAKGPDDAVQAASQFSNILLQVFTDASKIPEPLREAALAAKELALSSGRILAVDERGAAAIKERSVAAVQFFQEVLKGRYKQQAAAEDMLATLKEENTLRWAIVKFGEDSVEVETLRAVAARAALEEEMTAKGVSEALKVEMRKVFENTLALSQLDIASPINAAALAAQTLADRLGISLDIARKVVAATGEVGGVGGDPTVGGFEANDPRGAKPGVWTGGHSTTSTWKPETKSGGGARGGAGGGADAQAQAIARLIEQQQLQLAVLRESDPVMREMLRYRTAMAGATKEQRALLEQLITTRLREEDVLGRVQETQQFFQDTTFDALDGMIARGESLSDVMKNVAASIAQAAFQAALLGTGPLASLFGGGGGLLGFIGDALFPEVPAAADGGYLSGPGTGTSDDILMWGSNGEFMVNAAATARHRGLLEAINSGATPPQLAAGGLLATSPPSRTFGTRSPRSGANRPNEPAPALVTLRIKPSREFTTQIEETAERISVEVVGDYDRDVIPGSVQRVLEQPRRVG